MSMYDWVCPPNQLSAVLLFQILGLESPTPVGRLRDCYLQREEDGKLVIHIFTRNGGGNREHDKSDGPESEECPCSACAMKFRVPKLTGYIRDYDEEYDSTYATIVMAVPEQFRGDLEEVAALPQAIPLPFQQRFEAGLASLKDRIK